MKIKYLAISTLTCAVLLAGCNNILTKEDSSDKNEERNKQEQKQRKLKKDSAPQKNKASDVQDNNLTKNSTINIDSQSNNSVNNQQEPNQNNISSQQETTNNSYNEEVTNNSYNNEEYQNYLNIKKNTEDLKTSERPPGAGGGGASWNYTNDGESFEEWKSRTDIEKSQASFNGN